MLGNAKLRRLRLYAGHAPSGGPRQSSEFDDIELTLDPGSGDVISKSASVITTWADEGPGLTPDALVA
jgi:hypothetical protein